MLGTLSDGSGTFHWMKVGPFAVLLVGTSVSHGAPPLPVISGEAGVEPTSRISRYIPRLGSQVPDQRMRDQENTPGQPTARAA